MDLDEAADFLLSILSNSKNVEIKTKAAEFLIQYDEIEKKHFKDIKDIFIKDQHPQIRLKLIELLSKPNIIEGISFLKEQYKNCKDGAVRKKLVQKVGQGNLNHSIPFLIDALADSEIEVKKEAINLLGKTNESDALKPLINMLHFINI
jgi:HEAT repeat protein